MLFGNERFYTVCLSNLLETFHITFHAKNSNTFYLIRKIENTFGHWDVFIKRQVKHINLMTILFHCLYFPLLSFFFSGFLCLVCLTNHLWAARCHPSFSASSFLLLMFNPPFTETELFHSLCVSLPFFLWLIRIYFNHALHYSYIKRERENIIPQYYAKPDITQVPLH